MTEIITTDQVGILYRDAGFVQIRVAKFVFSDTNTEESAVIATDGIDNIYVYPISFKQDQKPQHIIAAISRRSDTFNKMIEKAYLQKKDIHIGINGNTIILEWIEYEYLFKAFPFYEEPKKATIHSVECKIPYEEEPEEESKEKSQEEEQ